MEKRRLVFLMMDDRRIWRGRFVLPDSADFCINNTDAGGKPRIRSRTEMAWCEPVYLPPASHKPACIIMISA